MKKNSTPGNYLSNINDLLQLPQFLHTWVAIIINPVQFFTQYHAALGSNPPDFWNIAFNKQESPWLGPVKFSALAIAINNLLLWPSLKLGVLAGAVSSEYMEFARWAEKGGYLGGPNFTGITIVDNILRDLIVLLVMYLLGALIWLFSQKKIPVRFAAGYYFYLNAWFLLSSVVSFGFILLGLILPVHATGLPQLADGIITFAIFFMFLGFPLLYWSEIIRVERLRIAISLLLGLIVWITIIAFTAPLIIPMPQL